jgi:23S rRNA pseudouridine1911/1915/1917 synthase
VDEVVPAALEGERLDRLVAMVSGASRAAVAELIRAGGVRVDGEVVTTRSRRLAAGERVEGDVAELGAPAAALVGDATIEVPIVYVDDDLVVVDKPAGLVVHPGAGHANGTLVQGLLARYPAIATVGDPTRPGIVHRLDKGTSGLLVVARSPLAYAALVRELAEHRVVRQYEALVWGHPEPRRGAVDAPIGRSNREPTRMTVNRSGKPARTFYEVIDTYDDPVAVARLECRLETGRTHQIRVHLAAIGHPVVGDARYAGPRPGVVARLDRPWLHAAALELTHPVTGAELAFTSPLPADLQAVLDGLR